MKKRFVVYFCLSVIVIAAIAGVWAYKKQTITTAPTKSEVGVQAIVYKSPTCGCCTEWEKHLKDNGFVVESRPREDMESIKKENHITRDLASCHTALIGGYVIEGHVPADDIRRLLSEKPPGVVGISVPGMPMGSPGMEGAYKDKFDVISFDESGVKSVFASH